MAINRTIQFKRNTNVSNSASEARTAIINKSSSLVNGEFILNSYTDENARGGIATMVGIKAQDQMFIIDNQSILNKLGINDDGTVNDNIDDSIEKLVESIISGAGLASDGTYSKDTSDKFLSGATSLSNADSVLSSEIKSIEDFIGMGGGATGHSIVEQVTIISGDVQTISGDVQTISGNVATISGNVATISGNVATLSAKSITDVEDTATIDLTKENATDGTKKIKADVKLSTASGNILSAATNGLYTSVDYDSATNSLVVNGTKKALNAGSIVDSITYDSTTEELIITYHTTTSSTPLTVKVNMRDLIEEYSYPAKDSTHNVAFTVTRNVSGATTVQAEVSLIDCGEY